MKAILKFVVPGLLLWAASAQAVPYKIDSAHSEVGFSVRHLVVSNVKGRFNKFEGSFDYDDKKAELSKIDVSIEADSVDTNEPKRDDHLKSADFFEVKKFPKLTFKSDKVEFKDKKPVKVTGNLTIKGVTKPVTLDIDFRGSVVDPWGNEKIGFGLTAKINRKDWGLNWNKTLDAGGVVVNDEVTLNIEVEANKVKAK